MLLTGGAVGWTLLLLSLRCPVVTAAVKVFQPYKVSSTNGTARVQCFLHPRPATFLGTLQPSPGRGPSYPYPDPEEVRVALLKGLHGNQEVCSTPLRLPEVGARGLEEEEEEVQCSVEESEGALVVTVSGLRPADTDVYRCEIWILYPPPYLHLRGNGTLVHVQAPGEDDCDCPAQGPQRGEAQRGGAQREGPLRGGGDEEEEEDEGKEPVSTAVVVLVILVTFVLVIIIIFFFQSLQCERVRRATAIGRCRSLGPEQ